jgi:hypothetical protein
MNDEQQNEEGKKEQKEQGVSTYQLASCLREVCCAIETILWLQNSLFCCPSSIHLTQFRW